MRAIIHKGLVDNGRWFTFSLMFQLANVGADVGRAINAKKQGNEVASQQALWRALELLDFTIEDPKYKKNPKLKELCRMREVLKDYFLGDNQYGSSDALLENEYYAYGYAAALERGR